MSKSMHRHRGFAVLGIEISGHEQSLHDRRHANAERNAARHRLDTRRRGPQQLLDAQPLIWAPGNARSFSW